MKSWVIGIKSGSHDKAYDWNDLLGNYFIQDTIGNQPVLLVLESDTSTFHAYKRNLSGRILFFTKDSIAGQMTDSNTHSVWDLNGRGLSGPLKDMCNWNGFSLTRNSGIPGNNFIRIPI
jgi:hypothetical protein